MRIAPLGGALQQGWRTGSPWLLDHRDEEAGREEQSSSSFMHSLAGGAGGMLPKENF